MYFEMHNIVSAMEAVGAVAGGAHARHTDPCTASSTKQTDLTCGGDINGLLL